MVLSSLLLSSGNGISEGTLAQKAIVNGTGTTRPASVCIKSYLEDGSIAICEDNPSYACPVCAALCVDLGYSYLCCDGDYCCCYTLPVACSTNPNCLTNSCA